MYYGSKEGPSPLLPHAQPCSGRNQQMALPTYAWIWKILLNMINYLLDTETALRHSSRKNLINTFSTVIFILREPLLRACMYRLHVEG